VQRKTSPTSEAASKLVAKASSVRHFGEIEPILFAGVGHHLRPEFRAGYRSAKIGITAM
jgi:hypothetical protein